MLFILSLTPPPLAFPPLTPPPLIPPSPHPPSLPLPSSYPLVHSGEHEGSRRLKTELLVQMDGLAKSSDLVFLLAASNLPWYMREQGM